MKKTLLLAPAVAVAIAGLAVGPATIAGAAPGSFSAASADSAVGTQDAAEAPEQPAPEPTADPNVAVSPEVTPEDLQDQNVGVTVLVSGAEPGSNATDSLVNEPNEVAEDGTAAWVIYANFEAEVGTVQEFEISYTSADGNENTVAASFTVVEAYEDETEEPTEDPSDEPTETEEPSEEPTETEEPSDEPTEDETEEAAEYALSVDPEEITPADFVDQDKGVQLTVTGLTADEEVEFSVAPQGEDVEPLTEVETADEDGVAAWNVYGINASDPSVYLGDYDVLVTNEAGEELEGAFTVTDNPGGNDDGDAGEDNGNDDGGSKLPRTGMELTGLAAGAGLLAVGAATVMLTRRRANQG